MEEKIQNKYQESVEEKHEEVVEKPVEVEQNIEIEPSKETEPVKEVPMQEKEIPPAPTTSPASNQVQQQVKQLKGLDRQNQVKALCNLAFQEGLDFAIETAKNLDSAYILDELHDSLVDELKKRLIEEGKLKRL